MFHDWYSTEVIAREYRRAARARAETWRQGRSASSSFVGSRRHGGAGGVLRAALAACAGFATRL